jgi:hypothetical protein
MYTFFDVASNVYQALIGGGGMRAHRHHRPGVRQARRVEAGAQVHAQGTALQADSIKTSVESAYDFNA